jgi:hypothetical protein
MSKYDCQACVADIGPCFCNRDCGRVGCAGEPRAEGESYALTSTERTQRMRSYFSRTGEVPSHGVLGYTVGCRCRTCVRMHVEYQREWRQKHRVPGGRGSGGSVANSNGMPCPLCNRMVRINGDKTIRRHPEPGGFGNCRASGKNVESDA